MQHYCPNGRRNHCRPLKRLLDTWDRNGSTSGPAPWQIWWWWWWWWCLWSLSNNVVTAQIPVYHSYRVQNHLVSMILFNIPSTAEPRISSAWWWMNWCFKKWRHNFLFFSQNRIQRHWIPFSLASILPLRFLRTPERMLLIFSCHLPSLLPLPGNGRQTARRATSDIFALYNNSLRIL